MVEIEEITELPVEASPTLPEAGPNKPSARRAAPPRPVPTPPAPVLPPPNAAVRVPSGGGATAPRAAAPPTAEAHAEAFARRLETDPAFRHCRDMARAFQYRKGNRPGVLWLRNVVNSSHGYEKRQIRALTPQQLCASLRACLEKTNALKELEEACPIDEFSIVYSTLEQDGALQCATIAQVWPEILPQQAAAIADPALVFGFFLTYPRQSSASTIVTPFQFPMG